MSSIILLSYGFSHSQEMPVYQFGFKTGLNIFDMYGDDEKGEPTGVIGNTMYISFYGERRLSGRYFLSSEALYSWAESAHFIEIPLFLKWRAFHRFFIMGGPKMDVLVYAYTKDPNPIKFSIEIGAMYYPTKRLFLESRYSYGFSNHLGEQDFMEIWRRNTFRLGLGLQF